MFHGILSPLGLFLHRKGNKTLSHINHSRAGGAGGRGAEAAAGPVESAPAALNETRVLSVEEAALCGASHGGLEESGGAQGSQNFCPRA